MPASASTAFSVSSAVPPVTRFDISEQPARWTSGTQPVIYASENAAGALAEFRAHLQSTPARQLRLSRIQLPEIALHEIEPGESLPWRERPYRAEVQALGDAWLERGETLTARVPSALCPAEFNLLINPRHPAFMHIRYLPSLLFELDQRLF